MSVIKLVLIVLGVAMSLIIGSHNRKQKKQ